MITLDELIKIYSYSLIVRLENGEILFRDDDFKAHLYDVLKIEPVSKTVMEVIVK